MSSLIFLSLEACKFFQIYGPPPEEWFDGFSTDLISLPSYKSPFGDIVVATPEEIAFIEDANFAALVSKDNKFLQELKSDRRPEAFNRILRLIQASVEQSISIPALWKPFNSGSLISIQSNPRASGERARILFDRKCVGSICGVCYGFVSDDIDLETSEPDTLDYSLLGERLKNALQSSSGMLSQTSGDLFELEANNKILGLGDSLQTWYDSKLTKNQRNFADFPLTKSSRVRGPGGSGKTIAMVVKVLRHLEADRKLQKRTRYALITHSEATVELIRSMMRTMVSEDELLALTENWNLLFLGTIYSLAFETLGTELRGVSPLSLDGSKGREMQKELLSSVFNEYMDSDWFGRKGGCSDAFVLRIEQARDDANAGNTFLLEVLNEFACVIEPEGIARSAQRKLDYANKGSRETWRLQLATPDERRVILDLHAEFRKHMREMETISVDQLIADFDRFLDSNAWEVTRSDAGFDVIFVDELHLLNRMERMLVVSLQKDFEAKPLIIMAEDVKQDVRRTGNGLKSWQDQLVGLKDFDFDEVFRYTPQINAFLRAIDEFAPTLHLDEDWPNYKQRSQLPPGPKPEVRLLPDLRNQYDVIFPLAAATARKRKNGRSVAVLTCDYAHFKQYLSAGQHRDLFVPVESREDMMAIPNRGVKFIFSMPEFVAGLQFEEVFLIDVSVNAMSSGEAAGVRDKRRGLSMVYLGGSRAMKVLHVTALKDEGGLPTFIEHTIETGVAISG